ncbi:MAG: MIP/aquaporin family protein [Thermoguttaceae bacterium]
MKNQVSVLKQCLAELVGTFILVFFGIGVVHAAVLTGTVSGLWQVAIVWAICISLAIYTTGAISGAHLNPAVTCAFAVCSGFPKSKVIPYIFSQLIGAFCAAALLFVIYSGPIGHFEKTNNIIRGEAGSELSGMIYVEYFPNPGIAESLNWEPDVFPLTTAMLAEGVGTAFLVFFIFALTDSRNKSAPGSMFIPLMIGLTVAVCIMVIAPLTQAGFNPARDFGPRLFAFFAGWGKIAIPGPRGGFLAVYILSPIIGGILGGGLYNFLLRRLEEREEMRDMKGK